jgi:hypothetical protein
MLLLAGLRQNGLTSIPPTPDRGRGWSTELKLYRSRRLELEAGQALGATPCSPFFYFGVVGQEFADVPNH